MMDAPAPSKSGLKSCRIEKLMRPWMVTSHGFFEFSSKRPVASSVVSLAMKLAWPKSMESAGRHNMHRLGVVQHQILQQDASPPGARWGWR